METKEFASADEALEAGLAVGERRVDDLSK